MTDRYNAFIVVLETNLRADDAQPLMDAIRMLRGVADVTPNLNDVPAKIALVRARQEIRQEILDLVFKERDT